MKSRRRTGATLGLIIVCVLVIIVIGIGCFFLAKICGGGREVTNATDAGTLNVAKEAVRSTFVQTASPADFLAISDPQYPGQMTLYSYNRAVAQALLVALNAEQEGTGAATGNAGTVFGELTTVGNALSGLLEAQGTLQGQFNNVAGSNSLKMYGNNPIAEVPGGYKWAFMKPGGSTNIWWNAATFPPAPAATPASLNLVSAGPLDKTPSMVGDPAPYMNKYMVGYQAITVPTVGLTFYGVPVFPQQTPHLVRLADFNTALAAPTASTPPNAFSCQSQSKDSKSGSIGGALACAIVGVAYAAGVNNPVTSPVDFLGCIPGGYIMIKNEGASTPPGGWGASLVYDNTNNIFNYEMNPDGTDGDIMSTPSGGNYIFYDQNSPSAPGNGGPAIAAWGAYNNPANSIPPGTADPAPPLQWNNGGTITTGAPPIPLNLFVTQAGGGFAPAAAADLEAMGPAPGSQDCMSEMNTPPYYPNTPSCGGNSLLSFAAAYGRTNGGAVGSTPSPLMWSAADSVKADVIRHFNQPFSTAGVDYDNGPGPGGSSGLGNYKDGMTDGAIQADPMAANEPWNKSNPPPLETTGPNAYDLLDQVLGGGGSPSCTLASVLGDMTQRANEIVPGTTQPALVTLLKSSPALNMGTILYICKTNPDDPTSALTIKTSCPTAVGGAIPDGSTTTSDASCSVQYPLSTTGFDGYGLIDSKNMGGGGDNGLHDQPYTYQGGPGLNATDHADFVLSSGYQNLLGQLHFYQLTGGSDSFSRPN
jgi:hypothetical protein